MEHSEFSFKNLAEELSKDQNFYFEKYGYWAGTASKMIFFNLGQIKNIGNKGEGWKFHISIDDQDQNNLIKAWDIVVDILIDNKVEAFKICKPNIHMEDKDPKATPEFQYAQRGKQITIYDYNNIFEKNRAETWRKILTKITNKFVENNINPSYRTPYDKPINGSSYITYRNDYGLKGEKRSTQYNPSEQNDPYVELDFSNINQPQVPLKDKEEFTKCEKSEEEKDNRPSANLQIMLSLAHY